MPIVFSFIPRVFLLVVFVLLLILTVCLVILIAGPVIRTVVFLLLPAGEGEGGRGGGLGADLWLAIWAVFCFILLAEREQGKYSHGLFFIFLAGVRGGHGEQIWACYLDVLVFLFSWLWCCVVGEALSHCALGCWQFSRRFGCGGEADF